MKTFKISFTGRKRGAIGSFYPICFTLKAANAERVFEEIYEKYEHLQFLRIQEESERENII